MTPEAIARLGLDVAGLKKDAAEAQAIYDKIAVSIEKLESVKAKPGSLSDLVNKNKELIAVNQQLQASYDALAKRVEELNRKLQDGVSAAKNTSSATTENAKSFTQNTAEVEKNIQKQKELKKELEGITATRKQLNEFQGKVNFDGNDAARVQIEKELVDLSDRELVIKKQISELNKDLTSTPLSESSSFQGNNANEATTAKAREKEETRQLNAELKAQAQLELATVGSISEAKAAVSLLTKERDKLNLSTEEGVKRQTELNIKIDEYNAFIKTNSDRQSQQRLNVGNYPSSFSGAFTVLEKELAGVKTQLQDPALQGKQLESLKNQEALLTQITENLKQQFTSTRQELRAYQEAAKQLGLSLGDDSQAFNDFASEVGGARDEIEDLQARVNFNTSDTKFLDGAIEGVNGLAGAYSAATGAVALFGDESADTQKVMVKLQALIAITTGLQQVQNIVQRESATSQTLLIAKTNLLALAKRLLGTATAQNVATTEAEAVAQTEAAVATEAVAVANTEAATTAEAATVALGEEAAATEVATAATYTLAEAFAATGIGAIIIAIGAAVVFLFSKLKDYTDAAGDVAKANVNLTASLKDQYETLQKQSDLINDYNRDSIRDLQNQNAVTEALGVNQAKQFELNAKLIEQNRTLAQSRLSVLVAENEQKYAEQGLKGIDGLKKAQANYLTFYDNYLSRIQIAQNKLRQTPESDGTTRDALNTLIGDLQRQAEGVKTAYDTIANALSAVADANLDSVKNQLEQAKYNAAEERKLTLALTEFEVSNVKSRNAAILSDTRSSLAERLAAINSNAIEERKLAAAQLADVKNNPESSRNDILIAEANYREKLSELKRNKLQSDFTVEEEYRKREINAYRQYDEILLKEQIDFYNKASNNPALSLDQQLSSLQTSQKYQKDLIDINYTAKKALLENNDAADGELEAAELDYQSQITSLTIKGNAEREALIKSYYDRVQQETNIAQNALKNSIQSVYLSDAETAEQYAADVKGLEDSLAKKEISLNKYNQERKQLDNDYQIYSLASQLAKDKAELSEVQHTEAEKLALRKKIADEEVELAVRTAALKREAEQQLNDAIKAFGDELITLGQTIGDAGFQKRIDNYQKLTDASNKYYETEIANIAEAARTGAVSDEEAANRTTILRAEQQAKEEQYARQQKELKIKQARFDKAVSVARIIASTAEGVAKVFAEFGGLPIAYPLAAVIAALGAAQVATVLATPIPQYRNLTENHPGGLFIFGDRPDGKPEVALHPDGHAEVADSPRLGYGAAGMKVRLFETESPKLVPLSSDDINGVINRGLSEQNREIVLHQKLQEQNNKQAEIDRRQSIYNTNRIVKELRNNRPLKEDYRKRADYEAYLRRRDRRTNWD